MVVQCLMFGSRVHEGSHMSDMGENEVKRGNPQLLVALDFPHFDLR